MTNIDPGMFDLFREEVRVHVDTLARGLLDVETDPTNPTKIEPLMRAAHSIKGAARIVGIKLAVRISHAMEDALVAAQDGKMLLASADIDALLRGADVLGGLAELTLKTTTAWEAENSAAVDALEPVFAAMATGTPPIESAPLRVAATPVIAKADFPTAPPFEPIPIPPNPLPLPADYSMLDLFREELRMHLLIVGSGDADAALESLKQIRGAARIVKCAPVERVVVAMSAFHSHHREASRDASEWVKFTVSTLAGAIATDDEAFPAWLKDTTPELSQIAEVFELAPTGGLTPPSRPESAVEPSASPAAEPAVPPVRAESPPPVESVVRVTAQSLNRLMGLAGESLVQARWLPSFSTALHSVKKQHDRLAGLLEDAFHAAASGAEADRLASIIGDARKQATLCRSNLNDQTLDFEDHAARGEDLNARLYREVITSRMRPFGDGVHGLPRLVRDMARSLSKEAKLVIDGENTEVDRDILEKLESPLSHLIRNAVDHGIESPEARTKAGKPAVGTIRLEARHRAGMLHVAIADDGGGVNFAKLRQKIVDRELSSAEVVARMTEAELLEFLFLPGFSTATAVTEFSGRGVGLDVVQDTIRKVGGGVRITSQPGKGTTFHLQLPLTLSVIRAVVVNISGEPYAFPHNRIDRLIRVPRSAVRSLEHRQFIAVDGHNIGLVVAAQLLDLPVLPSPGDEFAVLLLSDTTGTYGLVVDSFRGEQDLVVRPLDPRLGKVPNLSAAAILDDGEPVLIVDVEDLIRSTDQYIQIGALSRCDTRPTGPARRKRVLVVDDSITVREVERQLLLHKGYDVAVAVDGMDGWNKIRAENFDLLVSDIDMPRMSGLQLVSAVRGDEKLRDLPVVIVSYKEREEDRIRGLEVGANCYLTKSSFHDNRFIEAIEDLIGPS
jgi:two-component system, chemotaxis family, sensor histidine kinase and response regulator WspE